MSATPAKSHQPPFSEFGIIARIFMALAVSIGIFAAVCFFTILSQLAYTSITGHAVDFSICYRFTGLIAGVVALVTSSIWVVWVGVYRLQHPARQPD